MNSRHAQKAAIPVLAAAMAQLDPEQALKIGPMNGRQARGSGLGPKARVAPVAGGGKWASCASLHAAFPRLNKLAQWLAYAIPADPNRPRPRGQDAGLGATVGGPKMGCALGHIAFPRRTIYARTIYSRLERGRCFPDRGRFE